MTEMSKLSSFRSYNEVDGIVTDRRDISPSDYLLKIEGFLRLLENKMKKYETSEFEAGKCKWRLIIYPRGDPSRDGEGHLSLFLRMVPDTNSQKSGNEAVDAIVKFFVYDQHSDTYYTAEGKARRFHAPNLEWGISKFLPLTTFNDSSNGYLVDGVCIFGVEVFVIGKTRTREYLMLKERPTTTYSWKIHKFSTLGSSTSSPRFYVGNYAWAIWLFPRGDGKGKDDSISVFLFLSNYNILNPDQKVHIEFSIKLSELMNPTPKGQESRDSPPKYTATHWFSAASTNWGWPLFLPLKTIKDNTMSDSFTLEAEVSILGEVDKFL